MRDSRDVSRITRKIMDKSILAARMLRARNRIVEAAEALGKSFDLAGKVDALKRAHAKDPSVRALLQTEAVADLLEAVQRGNANDSDVRISLSATDEATKSLVEIHDALEHLKQDASEEHAGDEDNAGASSVIETNVDGEDVAEEEIPDAFDEATAAEKPARERKPRAKKNKSKTKKAKET